MNTPRTTSARRRCHDPSLPRYIVDVEVSEQLERELAAERAADWRALIESEVANLRAELANERALTDRLGTWLCDISDQYQLAEHEQMGVIRCLMAWKRARNPAQTTTEGAE